LALPGIHGVLYVLLREIVRLQADRNNTHIFFQNGKQFLSSKTLTEYDKMLRASGFLRVHRSHLVNPTSSAVTIHRVCCN
jgi:two-component system LytT family response regulator